MRIYDRGINNGKSIVSSLAVCIARGKIGVEGFLNLQNSPRVRSLKKKENMIEDCCGGE